MDDGFDKGELSKGPDGDRQTVKVAPSSLIDLLLSSIQQEADHHRIGVHDVGAIHRKVQPPSVRMDRRTMRHPNEVVLGIVIEGLLKEAETFVEALY